MSVNRRRQKSRRTNTVSATYSDTSGSHTLLSMCDNPSGALAPFCAPANGSQLVVGSTYNITWDPDYFGSGDVLVQVFADFSPSSSTNTAAGELGFASDLMKASVGFYSWELEESDIGDGNAAQVSISMSTTNAAGVAQERIPGPEVKAVRTANQDESGGIASSGAMAAAIVVPLIVGLILLGLVACYLWNRRRNPDFRLRDLASGAGTGRGAPRTGGAIKMGRATADDKRQDGRNVFREEIRRQERAA